WSSPPGNQDQAIYAITEDRLGNIWFASNDSIVCFNGVSWRRYPVPIALQYHTLYTGGITEAPDGRMIYHTERRGLAALDPRTGRIEPIPHPQGRDIPTAERNSSGGLDSITVDASTSEHFFESFDGTRFKQIAALGKMQDKNRDI